MLSIGIYIIGSIITSLSVAFCGGDEAEAVTFAACWPLVLVIVIPFRIVKNIKNRRWMKVNDEKLRQLREMR